MSKELNPVVVDQIVRQQEEIESLRADVKRYQELIYAVHRKFPDESCHETALHRVNQLRRNEMTTHDRDKVIAAAKEAGFNRQELDWLSNTISRLYAIAYEAGRQAEREECAKVCELIYSGYSGTDTDYFIENECAEAIRARGDTKLINSP